MKNPLLIIFLPVKAASNFGCFGVLFAFMYIIILAGIVLSVLGKMLNGCSVENSYSEDCYSCGGTNIHEPYSGGSTSSSGRSTYSNPPPVSASSTARSLDAQGYRIGQIRKYLKENGYGDYRRKEIKEMIGK